MSESGDATVDVSTAEVTSHCKDETGGVTVTGTDAAAKTQQEDQIKTKSHDVPGQIQPERLIEETPSLSECQQELENLQTEPEGQQTQPEGQQTQPEGQQTELEGQQSEPEGQQTQPEGQQTQPEGQQTQPEGQQTQPVEGQQTQPVEGQQTQPEGQQTQPEGQHQKREEPSGKKRTISERSSTISPKMSDEGETALISTKKSRGEDEEEEETKEEETRELDEVSLAKKNLEVAKKFLKLAKGLVEGYETTGMDPEYDLLLDPEEEKLELDDERLDPEGDEPFPELNKNFQASQLDVADTELEEEGTCLNKNEDESAVVSEKRVVSDVEPVKVMSEPSIASEKEASIEKAEAVSELNIASEKETNVEKTEEAVPEPSTVSEKEAADLEERANLKDEDGLVKVNVVEAEADSEANQGDINLLNEGAPKAMSDLSIACNFLVAERLAIANFVIAEKNIAMAKENWILTDELTRDAQQLFDEIFEKYHEKELKEKIEEIIAKEH